ncbi:DUF4132 domain-containing protein [Parasulfitobacter algicola]|uniref:DUF4132 domain-containing protein n=1 Tax=Parasulfitobacter algicola TaxID=2614809 RepID=A0ABX2IST9_9RHOB|nr:DUF4132 domain-containing protein [Sulfitobacter algicola]NSX53424.1 DUF4132 domain-containing protein [Sulfitobacter algicola]
MSKPSASGFFSRLFSGSGQSGSSEVRQIFAHLDQIERGLSGKVANYVETGEGRPVLATLQAKDAAIQKLRQNQQGTYKEIEQRTKRENDFVFQFRGNPEGLARYLEALRWSSLSYVRLYGLNKKNIPDLIVNSISRLNEPRNYGKKELAEAITLADVLAAIKLLGGTATHLVIATLGLKYSNLRLRLEEGTIEQFLLENYPDAVIEGFQQMDANVRPGAIKRLLAYSSATDPKYLDFLFEQMGAGSTKVRDAARLVLTKHDQDVVFKKASDGLASSKSTERKAMVQILGAIGTRQALDALSAHRENEKIQGVLTLIDQFVVVSATEASEEKLEGAFIAADGSKIEIPPMKPLIDDGAAVLTSDDLAVLKKMEQANFDAHMVRYNEVIKLGARKPVKPVHIDRAQKVFDLFSGKTLIKPSQNNQADRPLDRGEWHIFEKWLTEALTRIPPLRALRIIIISHYNFGQIFSPYSGKVQFNWLLQSMQAGLFDLRHVIKEAQDLNVRLRVYRNRQNEYDSISPSSIIISSLSENGGFSVPHFGKSDAIWPLYIEQLDTIAEHLPPRNVNSYQNTRALNLLAELPAIPKSIVPNILFAAIGETRQPRELAQKMLKDTPDVDDTLIETLSDKRQAIRGNTARFLADRGSKQAVPALIKRLKTEKSEFARAELISAISRLGGDTSPYLSQKALLAEAEKLAAKLPVDKISWLSVDQAPVVRWADGKAIQPVVLDAWLKLALKLKAPGGSPLFDLYLDQLNATDVQTFSEWVLTSWIAYDSKKPAADEARAKALADAKRMQANITYYKNYTVDQLADMVFYGIQSNYLNSGTDSKGILALAHRAPPAKLAAVIAAYLKAHGKRVSQAKSLVEVLVNSGAPEAVQVLVATSTRFKQRTVREFAETSVKELAAERGWTEDELADRSVPTGGFEEGGVMELEVGEDGKIYTVRLDSSLTIKIFNPDGREVKGLPAGKDNQTKESKSILSTAKKTIKTVTAQQAVRLYDGMIGGRVWTLEAWRNDLNNHPILNRLTERVIWRGLDGAGKMIVSFRPTQEGDVFDAEGEDVDLSKVAQVDLIHSALIDEELRAAWVQHLEDFEIKPLFAQISRPTQNLTDAQKTETGLKDREGWLMEALRLRSATTKFGYDRGPIEDGAGFSVYQKPFRNAGITAELHFTGSYVPEDNIPVAITEMKFVKADRGYYGSELPLGKVPPLLLSEAWNDLHEIAAYGAFDEAWRKKGLY